ncbi:MAG: pseudouridine synthase [Arenimonas sp.]
MQRTCASGPAVPARHGVARVISKLGLGSRTQAARWVAEGLVQVNGRLVRDPEFPVRQGIDRIEIAGRPSAPAERVAIMLNKPRGLVTTASDEQDRDTVYVCLANADLPWLAPVGRLDKASEGLLLFCNDPQWAAALSAPGSGIQKTYHVQVDCVPEAAALARLETGIRVGDVMLSAHSVRLLRRGEKRAWLEIVLDEGKNRQIRRMLEALDIGVLRLIRVGIGSLPLGDLEKGKWRRLTDAELASLQRR